jgi:hypothetical protein
MRKLGLSLSLTSAAMAVRSAFKIASVNPVLWWNAESHRAALAGGAAALFQDSAGATAVSAVEQPVGLVRSIANSGPRKNLLTYSEQFDNAAWIKSAATIAANSAVAPNGALTADKIIENTVNTQHMVWRSAPNTGGLFTFSVSLKAAERGFARVFAFSSPPNDFTYVPSVYVNLTSGVIASSSQCVATMKTEGGGWWRLTVTTTAVFPKPNISFYVAACNAANSDSYAGDGVSGIYVWGAQLETGSVASDYQKITSGVEYLDALQATSTARPLLTARKNLLTYSGRFDAPAWTKNLSAAAVASAGIKITPGGAGYAGVYQQSSAIASATSATVFTEHAYMSSAGKTLVYLSTDNTANRGAVFNLAAGTVVFVATGYTATIRPSPDVGEGVYKCSITFDRASALAYPFIGPADNANGTSSGPSTDGIVVYGMQLEYGSAATSYQRVTTATDYDITSAPLMLQFDGVDDALSTGTFAAGTLPANADVYVVLGRSPGSGTVSVCSASPFKYLAVAEAGSNSRPDGESGVPGYAVNGVAISSTRNALHAELQRDGVARLLEVRGADLSSWLSFGVSAYAGIGLLGRIGAVLITPAQPDATRAKIRKALTKAYQITGVV